jgi:hypothetical protein
LSNHIKIYLDTSVINFLFAQDAPQFQQATIDLFESYIRKEFYQTYISDYVLEEINNTSNGDKRTELLKVISDYPIQIIESNKIQDNKIQELASQYLASGIIPIKKKLDALHIATSVVLEINFLVSWNFKHLANISKEARILAVNLKNSYLNNFRIITPLELMNDES